MQTELLSYASSQQHSHSDAHVVHMGHAWRESPPASPTVLRIVSRDGRVQREFELPARCRQRGRHSSNIAAPRLAPPLSGGDAC